MSKYTISFATHDTEVDFQTLNKWLTNRQDKENYTWKGNQNTFIRLTDNVVIRILNSDLDRYSQELRDRKIYNLLKLNKNEQKS